MIKNLNVNKIHIPIIVQSFSNSKSIKIIYKNEYIKITKPKWYSIYEIKKYLNENAEYINKKYIEYKNELYINQANNTYEITKALYKGEIFDIILKKTQKEDSFVEIIDKCFVIFVGDNIDEKDIEEFKIKALKNYFYDLAKVYIISRVEKISRDINIKYSKIKIKECKTIWGSCSSKGNLNFNYKLIQMPEWVIDCIIIHELCHRVFLNHSEEFWKLVYKYCTKEQYDKMKKWLKENKRLLAEIP